MMDIFGEASFRRRICNLLTDDSYLALKKLPVDVLREDLHALAEALLHIFYSENKLEDLLAELAKTDIEKTNEIATLFRGTTLTTKLLGLYSELIGKKYVSSALHPLSMLFDEESSLEVDIMRISSQGDKDEKAVKLVEKNQEKISRYVNSVINSITTSGSNMPRAMKNTCYSLRQLTEKKFPGYGNHAVSSWIFLRTFNPAIMIPRRWQIEGIGNSEENVNKSRRARMLISKIIQNIANGVEFGAKEDYMVPFNDLVKENSKKIESFMESISAKEMPSAGPLISPPYMTRLQVKNLIKYGRILVVILKKHYSKQVEAMGQVDENTHKLLEFLVEIDAKFAESYDEEEQEYEGEDDAMRTPGSIVNRVRGMISRTPLSPLTKKRKRDTPAPQSEPSLPSRKRKIRKPTLLNLDMVVEVGSAAGDHGATKRARN